MLPDADIVYDHFHVIKLMNERMNNLRKSTMSKLEDEQKKELKGKRVLLWAEKAEASGIRCLKQMAKTIRRRLDGLLAYWKHAKLTSASQEGFNNKIESA